MENLTTTSSYEIKPLTYVDFKEHMKELYEKWERIDRERKRLQAILSWVKNPILALIINDSEDYIWRKPEFKIKPYTLQEERLSLLSEFRVRYYRPFRALHL